MPEEQKQEEKKDEKKKDEYPLDVEKEPVVTEHSIEIDGQKIEYTVTAGMLPIRNETGSEVEAGVFFVAYTKKQTEDARSDSGNPKSKIQNPKSGRPLMFSFNGGPGSSSVWLHLGAVGPKRVEMLEDGGLPPAPYTLVDNRFTWFTETDLVFIDPVGTGYSRPKDKELGKKFWGLKGDIESVGEFIRLYLSRYDRWASPLFLVGESYGTTRASGLAGHLIERGIAFNGILLVSSILNFLTARWFKGNDLPNILFLPTYAATAWYHGKVDKKYRKDLQGMLREVEAFTMGPYSAALAKGDNLPAKERQTIIGRLAEFTGLSKRYIEQSNLRIEIMGFCKELLRDEGRTVGRLDSRFKGIDPRLTAERPEFDPSMTAIRPPYTAMFNDYVSRVLGYKTDVPYQILGGLFETWDWGSAGDGMPDVSESMRRAFARNPHMKLFVASGYFDLATPYFATKHTLAHMGLDAEVKGNITTAEFEAGHMMYIHAESLRKLKTDVTAFIRAAL
ncbi:MAG: S10 family peptidase [Fimbriimonadales bacterium]